MPLIHGEPSFELKTPELDLAVTTRAGHLAPVVFHLPSGDFSPYALAPWQPAEYPELPPLLSVLRGDFFCLPFGGQENGPPHGDTANASWDCVSSSDTSLHLQIQTTDSKARVEKILSVRSGQTAIYTEHRITGLDGKFNYGNHPIFDFSTLAQGTGRISTSPIRWASVYPGWFSDPADGASQALTPGGTFKSLKSVPLAAGGHADLTHYPERAGNDDLVMMVNEPSNADQPFAWSAAVFDGALWFSLKNPEDFPATMLWFSNGGRSASPWDGRHLARLGIEEVCSHFSDGIDISREDRLAAQGVPTSRLFRHEETVSLRIIQAAASLPKGFTRVASIRPRGDHAISILDESGLEIQVSLDWKFVL